MTEVDGPTEAPTFLTLLAVRSQRVASRIEGHVPLVLSLAAGGFVALKLAIVSKGSTTTALGLVQESSPATLLIGSATGTIAGVLAAIFLGCVATTGLMYGLRQRVPPWAPVAVVAVGLFSWLLWPTLALLVVLGAGAAYFAAGRLLSARWQRDQPRVGFLLAPTVGVLIGVVWLVTSRPWWPPESITLEGNDPMTAYVVSTNESTTVLLNDGQLIRVPTADIEERAYCDTWDGSDWWRRSLLDGTHPAEYPDCP